ncbi:MAG: ribonuclease P protein component [Candidatus Levybacteria bacterium]|nr:ribonuclease P protein component [Candidatus Levybacteria bacterium]
MKARVKMFKRENRLARGVKFNNSCNFNTAEFALKEKKNGLLLNRFGIVVSKKIDKRAVVRNRIKRIFRQVLSDLNKNMVPGHDILFITRIGVLDKTKEENYGIIKNALEKAGLIKK